MPGGGGSVRQTGGVSPRWRVRKERADSADAPEDRRDRRAEVPGDAEDGRDDADLSSRLEAVTSNFTRPPTAEELRAAFSRRHVDDEPPPRRADEFSARYPTETLFYATPEEPESDPVEHAFSEDRSRTKGDYYYDPEDAWGVLGLQPGAPWKQIAAAHRRLAMQHHPDRLLDATPEQRAASEETMREVNVAYSVLRRLTGN